MAKLIAGMVFFVVLAIPMFAYLWWSLNDLLASELRPSRAAISLPILVAFVLLLVDLARRIERWP